MKATPKSLKINFKLNHVKRTLQRRFASEFQGALPLAVIRRAVDEAEQIAHSTGIPHLVFPLLAEEIVRRVSTFMTDDAAPATALASLAA